MDDNSLVSLARAVWNFVNLDEVNNISGLLGTGISLYLLKTVRAVRRDFLFAARLPELGDAILQHASNLNLLLNAYDERVGELNPLFEICKTDLMSLSEKLNGGDKKRLKGSVHTLVRVIESAAAGRISKEFARDVYVKLLGVSQELKNLAADQKWSVRDVG